MISEKFVYSKVVVVENRINREKKTNLRKKERVRESGVEKESNNWLKTSIKLGLSIEWISFHDDIWFSF